MRALKRRLIISILGVALTIAFGTTASVAWTAFEPAQNGYFNVDGEPQLHITEVGGNPIEKWEARLKPTAKSLSESYTESDIELIKNDALVSKKSIVLTNTFNYERAIFVKLESVTFTRDIKDIVVICFADENGVLIPPLTFQQLLASEKRVFESLQRAEQREFTMYAWLNGVAPGCDDTILGTSISADFVFIAQETVGGA